MRNYNLVHFLKVQEHVYGSSYMLGGFCAARYALSRRSGIYFAAVYAIQREQGDN